MYKRTRAKSNIAAKTKANDKAKVLKPTNGVEISRKNEHISASQESVDVSPSSAKKAKLDSSQSPSAKNAKKYVPPFTASQRSARLRNDEAVSTEICEEKSNNREIKRTRLRPRGRQGVIPEDKLPCNSCVDTKQSDVKVEAGSVKGENTRIAKKNTEEDTTAAFSSLQEKSTIVKEIESNSALDNHEQAKDKNTKTRQEIGPHLGDKKVALDVPKLAVLSQQSCSLVEGNSGIRKRKEGNMVEKTIGSSSENSKESSLGQLKTNVTNVDVERWDVPDLQTLAETCAEEEYIDVLSVESETSMSQNSQNKLKTKNEIRLRSLSLKRKSNENKNSQDITKEKIPETNANTMPLQPDVVNSSPSKVSMRCITLSEPKSIDKLVNVQISSSKKVDRQTENTSHKCGGDRLAKSSSSEPKLQSDDGSLQSSSQEIIQEKLSEILSMVTEGNKMPLSGLKSEVITDTSRVTENHKSLENVADVGVADAKTEEMPIEDDKSTSRSDENNCMEKIDPNSLANGDKNSQNAACKQNNELQSYESMPTDNDCIPIEKVEDPTKELPARVAETNERVKEAISKKMELPTTIVVTNKVELPVGCEKEIVEENNNDQEVPNKIMTSPTSKKSNISEGLEDQCNKCIARFERTSDNSHFETKKEITEKKANVLESRVSNIVDEQSLAKEFEVLEELLPRDDMGLFDDVLTSQPKYTTRVEKELPDGDSTIEFLINELASLQCMVANYERAVQDMKRQDKFNNGKF